ncbi:hypothetical protein ACP70R_018041 [Stipagrostis hirtigluma subsp. patula]
MFGTLLFHCVSMGALLWDQPVMDSLLPLPSARPSAAACKSGRRRQQEQDQQPLLATPTAACHAKIRRRQAKFVATKPSSAIRRGGNSNPPPNPPHPVSSSSIALYSGAAGIAVESSAGHLLRRRASPSTPRQDPPPVSSPKSWWTWRAHRLCLDRRWRGHPRCPNSAAPPVAATGTTALRRGRAASGGEALKLEEWPAAAERRSSLREPRAERCWREGEADGRWEKARVSTASRGSVFCMEY